MSKDLHDQQKKIYRTSPGWMISMCVMGAFSLVIGITPIAIVLSSHGNLRDVTDLFLLFGFLGVMSIISVAGPWLAISAYGVEVSLVFVRAYTPWENVSEMRLDLFRYWYVYLTEPVDWVIWPFNFRVRTRLIPVSSYGTKADCVAQQVVDHVARVKLS